jgi:predicted MFS family arabinose efflux permease
MRTGLLGLAVGLALADSSIVTLALPEMLRAFEIDITTVAWALTSYNLVFALAVVPAAYVARRRPPATFAVGMAVFAAASLACGLAPSFEALVAARCVQAVGGALAVVAALDLLSQHAGERRAARTWVAAGVLGAALGPAVGGVLTQVLGWESIFLFQVPLALAALLALRGVVSRREPKPTGRPRLAPNAALFLLSGGLVAALFLVVLLLVDGWGMSPATAGLVVTVMPLAAIATGRLAPRATGSIWMAAGVVLVAGGLAALALLPRAGWAWTIAPQLLVGVGIGLAVVALTERALAGHAEQVVHGGWTLAARHAGVVVGLLLLAPVLTGALDRNQDDALNAGAAAVIDSAIPPLEKLRVAQDVLAEVRAAGSRELPDVAAAFEDRPDTDEYRSLLARLRDELDRAVTNAFSGPFLIAAALALAALVPIGLRRGEPL